MADTLQADGVLGGKTVALNIARHIQAGDDIAVCVVGVAVLVAFQTADAHQQQSRGELVGVEGAVLDRPQAGCRLMEVLIVAILCQLVVTLDGFQSSLLGSGIVRVHLGHQLFQRVCLQGAAVGHSGLQLIGALVVAVGRVVLGAVCLAGVVLVVAGTAVGSGHVRQLLGPVGVKDLPALAVLLQLDLVFQLLTGQVFVHEALAVQVQIQETSVAHDTHTGQIGTAAHVMDHGCVALLHLCAGPHAQLDAVALIGEVALHVHIGEQTLDVVLDDLGAEVLQHLGVLGVIAGGEDHALGSVALDVLAGGGIAGIQTHTAAIVHDELLDEAAVEGLHIAGVNSLLHVGVDRDGLVGQELHRCRIVRLGDSRERKKRPHLVKKLNHKSIKEGIQMKQNRIFDQNSSQKARSWHYNMDTNRAEAQFADGSAIAIDCLAIEDEYGNTPAQRAELDWLLYNKPLECVQLVLSGEIEHYLSLGCDHGKLKD